METGQSWRRHAWTRARADLMPRLPIEVLRLRVNRARELGLPYRTYASVRASTGRDVIGFLFSSNALRVHKGSDVLPDGVAEKLLSLQQVTRVALNYPGIVGLPPHLIDAEHPAPPPFIGWSEMRQRIQSVVQEVGLPADGLIVVGETASEREWTEAGRMAGFLTGRRYFDPAA